MDKDDPQLQHAPDQQDDPVRASRDSRPPALNLPTFVVVSVALLVVIHAALEYGASQDQRFQAILYFSFIPARYGELAGQFPLPMAAYWTPFTYSLLHGGWVHLWMNVLWMVVFAAPLVRRLGGWRTLAIAASASLGGAGAHWLFHAGEVVPVVGASAVVSGYMGAAARFAFRGQSRNQGFAALNVHGPALSLAQSFTNRRFLSFFAVWMVINLVFGITGASFGGTGAPIAWQAHIGGFLAGLLTFSIVDIRQHPA